MPIFRASDTDTDTHIYSREHKIGDQFLHKFLAILFLAKLFTRVFNSTRNFFLPTIFSEMKTRTRIDNWKSVFKIAQFSISREKSVQLFGPKKKCRDYIAKCSPLEVIDKFILVNLFTSYLPGWGGVES